MAVLNKIRQRGLFLIIVIALALFSFVLADLFRNSDALTSKGQNIIATINGKDISSQDFMEKVEIAQQSGQNTSSIQAMERVWEQETRRSIMSSQFENLGISVEAEEMKDLLKTSLASAPDFLNEAGIFDENRMNEFIANLKEIYPEPGVLGGQRITYKNWVEYESGLAANALQQNYFNMVRAGIGGTVAEGELQHQMESELVDIKFVQIPYSSISDSTITVSKSDITAYMNKNKSKFEVEESRDIAYVQFNEVASLADEEALKVKLNEMLDDKVEFNKVSKTNETIAGFKNVKGDDIVSYINVNSAISYNNQYSFKSSLPTTSSDSLFNRSIGDIYGPYKEAGYIKLSKIIAEKNLPDSAQARHILIPYGPGFQNAKVRTEVEAKKTADSVLGVLKRNRSKFSALAKQMSADTNTSEKGGHYDWFSYNSRSGEFRDFIFEGKKGDLDIVKAPYGFHIIEIEGQKNFSRAIKVATLAEKIEASQETIDATFTETSKFEIAVSKGDFETVAKESNYTLRPVNSIKALEENIPGIGNQRSIVKWAFNEDAKIGDVKRFNFNGGYAVVQLRGRNKAGLMNTEDASVTATPAIRKEKKAEIIRKRILGKSFEDVSASEVQAIKSASALNMKNPTITGAGREPMVVGAAFGLKEGGTSAPIDGVNGVYLVQVTKKTPAVKLDSYQAKVSQLTTQRSNSLTTRLYNALKEAADIEDNRSTVY